MQFWKERFSVVVCASVAGVALSGASAWAGLMTSVQKSAEPNHHSLIQNIFGGALARSPAQDSCAAARIRSN